tara:strand:+ start:1039 stop:1599 length:561 start_codon:yes stop_codon:yes gene_type:complete
MKIINIFLFISITLLFSEETVNDTTMSIKEELLPDTFLKDLDNKKVSILEYLDSKPALISFWFLACEPCKKEMKYLDQFNQKYSDTGFKVLSINTDNSRAIKSVKPFVESKKYSFKVLNDPRSSYQRKLKGTSCPYTVMVDHNGVITSRHVGYNAGDEKKLELEIIELINKTLPDSLKIEINQASE